MPYTFALSCRFLAAFVKKQYSKAVNTFLPVSRDDMKARGWDTLDFLLITGDAYVDHPSFGAAIISRLLESKGFNVGIIAQPDWKSTADFKVMGKPRLGILITSGNLDSMVNNYSVSKRKRREDAYAPGGEYGHRPDRALLVFATRAREAFKKVPIILGGIEASLRRFAHYDYWSDKVRRSVLLDAKADMLVYGMGERQIVRIAEELECGKKIKDIQDIPGTVYLRSAAWKNDSAQKLLLPSFEEVSSNKRSYAEAFQIQFENSDAISGKDLIQAHGDRLVVQNSPSPPLETDELDEIYELPYARTYHPKYQKSGGVPSIQEVRFSLVSSRGCFGGCSFCALTYHQGRSVRGRSHRSLVNEAKMLSSEKDFKGYIHDVGGPTANFRTAACKKQLSQGVCSNRQCMHPKLCNNLEVDHKDYVKLLRKIRSIPSIKKTFIRSGIRYDYLLADPDDSFFNELCEFHVSGQLKVAPEHVTKRVLDAMGKPDFQSYERFEKKFRSINKRLGKKQYLIPYFISSHPGSDLKAAIQLAEYFRDKGFIPNQVQDFYPTPGTLSTCMFYTEIDPRSMKPIFVPKGPKEKAWQRALMHFSKPENHGLVKEALIKAGRQDLIGTGPKCLIAPHLKSARGPRSTTSKSGGFHKKKGMTKRRFK